mmetsp:Transcript_7812/g.19535  ORF Transcript_7812/g.19535 Transcript_7812/m.19535 type:complete len:229 (+) Transcript_7812:1318-2004(+)
MRTLRSNITSEGIEPHSRMDFSISVTSGHVKAGVPFMTPSRSSRTLGSCELISERCWRRPSSSSRSAAISEASSPSLCGSLELDVPFSAAASCAAMLKHLSLSLSTCDRSESTRELSLSRSTITCVMAFRAMASFLALSSARLFASLSSSCRLSAPPSRPSLLTSSRASSLCAALSLSWLSCSSWRAFSSLALEASSSSMRPSSRFLPSSMESFASSAAATAAWRAPS